MSFTDSYISSSPAELYFVVYIDYENSHTTKKIFEKQEEAKEYYNSLKRLFLDNRRYEMSNTQENIVQYYYDSLFYSRKIGEISITTIKL